MIEHQKRNLRLLCIIVLAAIFAASAMAASNSSFSRIWEKDSSLKTDQFENLKDNNPANSTASSRADYAARLVVYVVEPTGRWLDNGETLPVRPPKPFGNAVIGFAIDQDIYVSESEDFSIDWDADAAGFGDITEDNIKVVGVLYNSEIHQGHSDPPTGSPYDAHYVDAVVDAFPGETQSNDGSSSYTHTVFLEETAATW